MTRATWQIRRRVIASCVGALLAVVALPAGAQAGEYHSTVWDIGTNGGRNCGHGTNGWLDSTVDVVFRNIGTETSVGCDPLGPGQAATLWADLYLFYDYGTDVDGSGVGGEFYNGGCTVTGQFCAVRGSNQMLNVPSKYTVVPVSTWELPTTGGERFTIYPSGDSYDCRAYFRIHSNGWWYASGLNCIGSGVFNA